MDGGADSGAGGHGHRAGAIFGAVAGAALGWGLVEAGWPRFRELELPVPGLPPELDGLRVVHLSDFHLGVPSPGVGSVAQAIAWTVRRKPDLVVVTGDLLTHPRGEPLLARVREVAAEAGRRRARQPRRRHLPRPAGGALRTCRARRRRRSLRDEGTMLELRGTRIWIAGVDPRLIVRGRPKRDPNSLSADADFRILLCHYPRVVDALEPGRFELVLAGHMHDGQIALPYPGGKVRFAHLTARYPRGVYRLARRRDARIARVSGRPSSRSASPPVPRRPSSRLRCG